ncbi:MAG TPA: hypothetical protein VFV54_00840, partial [Thermoanaerobaculia bacterium]|nr:hypothetical protein [Thermoanaerobaculia bacterium]
MGDSGWIGSGLYTESSWRQIRTFNWWAISAALLFVATTLLLDGGIIAGPLAWALAAATVIVALFAVRAYRAFLHGADELLRKIQLEGLALGFGAGVVFMLGYRLLERLGAPKLDVNDPLLVLVVFW